MKAGTNSGRVMDTKVLDYAAANVPCWVSYIVSEMSRDVGIPVSRKYVEGVLEDNGYEIVDSGGILLVDRVAPEEQAG